MAAKPFILTIDSVRLFCYSMIFYRCTMKNIRKATQKDLARIAEIEVFNYRLNFYPIFKDDDFYFSELQVLNLMESYQPRIETMWVYDDGVIKGFVQVSSKEIKKLFVEPALQGNAIGSNLLNFAIEEFDAYFLWALEKNVRAIKFYQRHGFRATSEKKFEEDTTEYLVRMERDILKETNRSE